MTGMAGSHQKPGPRDPGMTVSGSARVDVPGLLRELAMIIACDDRPELLRHVSRTAAMLVGASQAATSLIAPPDHPGSITGVHLSFPGHEVSGRGSEGGSHDRGPNAQGTRREDVPPLAGIGALALAGTSDERLAGAELAADPRYAELVRAARPPLDGLLAVSLADAHGRPLGRIALSGPLAGRFSQADSETLGALASAASAALARHQLVASLAEAQRQRQAFFGVVSHELRTPITTIYGGTRVLKRTRSRVSREAREQLLDDISQEAERLYRLVEDLLVLSRAEREALVVTAEPILLQHLVPRVVDSERPRWPGAQIRVEAASSLPPVMGDSTLVEQVVRNLVSNAAKYAGDAGPIDVVAAAARGRVAVRVLDQGPGVDPRDPERVFELYYRAPDALRRGQGAGIGLYVCRELVLAMDGDLWVRARKPHGAEFGFQLRAYEADQEDGVAMAEAVPAQRPLTSGAALP